MSQWFRSNADGIQRSRLLGLGAGGPTDKRIEEAADHLAFPARIFGMKVGLSD